MPFWIIVCILGFLLNFAAATPYCEETYGYVEVGENSPIGTVVKEISCSTSNTRKGQLTYNILDGNTHGKFEVNTTNGIGKVFVYQPVSYESRVTQYRLTIQVSETEPVWRSISYMLDIQVTGVNDYAPLFLFAPYSVYVSEGTRPGSVISNPIPYDFDRGGDGSTTSVILDDDDMMFYMDPRTAKVYLRAPFDYERKQDYTVTLQVTDDGIPQRRSSTTVLNIHVKDVNDNPPVCDESFITVTFDETKESGSILKALKCSDVDTGNNGRLTYTLVSGDYTKFRVQGPFLLLSRSIDVDKEPNVWTLSVLVRDRGDPRLSTMVDIFIHVLDMDDNRPQWAPPQNGNFVINLKEHEPIGSHVTRLSAEDPDMSDRSDTGLVYYMDDQSGMFSIEAITGNIYVNRDIDREVSTKYTIPVSAVSRTSTRDKITTLVIVNVLDINDNIPTFEQDVFHFHIPENLEAIQEVAMLTAVDMDNDLNGQIVYRIMGGNSDSVFNVNSKTGRLSLTRNVDYESVQVYRLLLQAADRGRPSLSSTCTIIISVDPINEFAPIFESVGKITASESVETGTSLFKVRASDGDFGLDGDILYSVLTDTSDFVVESKTGIVRLFNKLDRERSKYTDVVLLATDQSETNKYTGSVTVELEIEDENDNVPVCEPFYNVLVKPPIQSGQIILTIKCTDADVGPNGRLTYALISGNTNTDFSITPNGDLVVLRNPTSAEYDMEVEVSDGGKEPYGIVVQVIVKTGGQPVFQNIPEEVSVFESENIGNSIYEVSANSVSQQIRFKIGHVKCNDEIDTTEVFKIDKFTGMIYSWREIDREQCDEYTVEVTVSDLVSDITITDTLTIDVLDINDHTPIFGQTLHHLSVIENIKPGTTLLQLEAADPDEGVNGEIMYDIINGNEDDIISINQNGYIVLRSGIDRERLGVYTFVITANDGGDYPKTGSATFLLTVLDSDEYDPEFVNMGADLEFSLREDTPLGMKVFVMTARDMDFESNLVYTLSHSHFIIDSDNGDIYLSKQLDRESEDLHEILVTASEKDKSVTAQLTVFVTDVNDNHPKFHRNVYRFDVFESTSFGQIVGDIGISDEDQDENGYVSMSITKGNINNMFDIHHYTLVLIGELSYENYNEYILQIEAKDEGFPTLSSTATVIVQVIPMYRMPKFALTVQYVSIPENTHVGIVVHDVDATLAGAKEGTTGELIYTFKNSDDNKLFSIDKWTGEVTLVGKLSNDVSETSVSLYVLCYNIYNDDLKDETLLQIKIVDVNNMVPAFENKHYTFDIREDHSMPLPVDSLSAVDKDKGQNSYLLYEIVDGDANEIFKIDEQSGKMFLKQQPDIRDWTNLYFTVIAIDHGTPSLTGSAYVQVNIIDVNNNAPVFEEERMVVYVRENVPLERNIFKLRAYDEDSGVNAEILYSVLEGNANNQFDLDRESGELKIIRPLDREKAETYILVIIAEDQGYPTLSSTGTLTVVVTDINDNTPTFANSVEFVSLDRFSPVETHVISVQAIDQDKGKNAKIEYQLASGNDTLFQIDSENGHIFTFSDLSQYPNNLLLYVLAKDGGFPRLSSMILVSINLHPVKLIDPQNFNFTVSEYRTKDTFIGSVGSNITMVYDISSGNYNQTFRVTKAEGKIYLNNVLDREVYSDFYLKITASYPQSLSSQVQLNIHIKVLDENDNSPQFTKGVYSFELLEHAPVGHRIGQIYASDRDIGNNSKISYSFREGPNVNVDFLDIAESGLISLKQSITFRIQNTFEVSLLAVDSGLFPRTGTCQVVINIIELEEDAGENTAVKGGVLSLDMPVWADRDYVVTTLTPSMFGLNISSANVEFNTYIKEDILTIKNTGEIVVIGHRHGVPFDEGETHLNWVVANMKSTEVSSRRLAVVRTDTFVPENHVVVLTHSVSSSIVEMKMATLLEELKRVLKSGRPVIWMQEDSNSDFRRKLLITESKSYLYVVADTTTDTLEGLDAPKTYLPQEDLLRALGTDDNGTPTALNTEPFDSFPVISVERYTGPDPIPQSWIQTTTGKVVLGLGLAILFFAIILIVVLCELKKKSKKVHASRRNSLEINIQTTSTQAPTQPFNNQRKHILRELSDEMLPLINALRKLGNLSEHDRDVVLGQSFNPNLINDIKLNNISKVIVQEPTIATLHPSTRVPTCDNIDETKKKNNEKGTHQKNNSTPFSLSVDNNAVHQANTKIVEANSQTSKWKEKKICNSITVSESEMNEERERSRVSCLDLKNEMDKNKSDSTDASSSSDDASDSSSESSESNQSEDLTDENPSPLLKDKITVGGVDYDAVGTDTSRDSKYLYNSSSGEKLYMTDGVLKTVLARRGSMLVQPDLDRETQNTPTKSPPKSPLQRQISWRSSGSTTVWEMSADEKSDEKEDGNQNGPIAVTNDSTLDQSRAYDKRVLESDVCKVDREDHNKRHTKDRRRGMLLQQALEKSENEHGQIKTKNKKANEDKRKDKRKVRDLEKGEVDEEFEDETKRELMKENDKTLNKLLKATKMFQIVNDTDDTETETGLSGGTMSSKFNIEKWKKVKKLTSFVRPIYKPMNLENVECKVPKGKSKPKDCLSKDPVYTGWAKMVGRRLKKRTSERKCSRSMPEIHQNKMDVGSYTSSVAKRLPPHLARRRSADSND